MSNVTSQTTGMVSPTPVLGVDGPAALSWRPVHSSSIRELAYVPGRRILMIQFVSGRAYAYSAVPEEIFEGFKAASSAGHYFNQWIKDRYPSNRVR
ncbi:MAG TPA: KTSC domain-containing protein [Polyangiaceae bacterium]|nr:KTSC domain-containing protein [Polyangiaceae bacterium]